MIRVRKSEEPGQLAQEGYACDAVKRVLIADTDEKCYICERKRDTDFEVEHLKSRKKNPDLENNWQNLYAACGYCNKKKGCYHDNMLHPDLCDVEEVIEHKVNLVKEIAEFYSEDKSEGVKSAVKLLIKVFNGARRHNKPRPVIEQRFWDYFKKEYNDFLTVVDDFLSGNEAAEDDIRELLDIQEEFLAFKYSVIKNNPTLLQVFQNDIVWNKGIDG